MYTCTCAQTLTHMYTYTHPHKHEHTHVHMHAHAHTHTNTNTHMYTCTHAQTLTHTCTCTHTHTNTHVHTHALTYSHLFLPVQSPERAEEFRLPNTAPDQARVPGRLRPALLQERSQVPPGPCAPPPAPPRASFSGVQVTAPAVLLKGGPSGGATICSDMDGRGQAHLCPRCLLRRRARVQGTQGSGAL